LAIPISAQEGQTLGPLIGLAIGGAVLILRSSRARALKIERLWIRPAILMTVLAGALYFAPPPLTLTAIAIILAALALGAALGWQRARFFRIEVHPETHALTSQPSVWGMLFILGLLVLRVGMRSVMSEGASLLGVPAVVIADALVVFAVGMFVVQGIEIWIRARRLLAEAQAAKANVAVDDPSKGPPIVQ